MARIGVDFSVTAGKFQGSRSYLLGLYEAAIAACPEHEFLLYTPDPPSLANWPGLRAANARAVRLRTGGGAWGRLALWLPQAVRRDAVDVIHTQYMLPVTRRAKRVTTIHDVLFEDHAAFFSTRFLIRSRVLIGLSAKMADRVLTVSHYCAERIAHHYCVSARRIAITENGADPRRFAPTPWPDEFYRELGIAAPGYILAVGRLEARKNIGSLVRAYLMMPQPRPQLVIVGRRDPAFHDPGLDLSQTAAGEIVHLDSVSDADLPGLYAGADVFAYPSLAEGFGMPLIEAMASGVPVVCSDRTAIPEVAGDAALIVDPNDTGAFAAALTRLVRDAPLRERLREAGFLRVRHYSWDRAALVLKRTLAELAR